MRLMFAPRGDGEIGRRTGRLVERLPVLGRLIAALFLQEHRRREAERSLRLSEQRYRGVVESQTDMICRYLPDTTLTFVNEAYCRYFGRSREQLLGTRFAELIPGPQREAALAHVRSIIARPRVERFEHQVMRPDGSHCWQEWIDQVILGPGGEIEELQAIGRDITDLKTAQSEARERGHEVAHLTRVALVGELSGALAHELNQPLTALLCNSQAARCLLDQLPDAPTEIGEILDDLIADSTRAAAVIARLRSLLRREAAGFAPLDLNELVRETLKLLSSELLERRVATRLLLQPDLPLICADRVQLQQVLLNLILNACDAMRQSAPVGRVLSVATGTDHQRLLLVSIGDTGTGFGDLPADQLFASFFTTKPDGLGLGLPICLSIMADHGGRLWAVNNPEGGATFTVAMPAIEEGRVG